MGEKYIFPEDVLKRDITKKITTHFNTVIHSPKLWLTLIIPPIAVIIIGLAVFAKRAVSVRRQNTCVV